jgi:hypothetical protein
MEQLNIYHTLGLHDDPIYSALTSLEHDKEVELCGYKVIKNQSGLYEVFNDEVHECFNSIEKCYAGVNLLIEKTIGH